MKRLILLTATALAVAAATSGAAAAPTLPTINVSLTGTSIAVTGSAAGAVNVTMTSTSNGDVEPTLVHLNPGVTADQVLAALPTLRDPNDVRGFGEIVFDQDVTKGTTTVQTMLPPGDYMALDTHANNPAKFGHSTFTVAQQADSVASLPPAAATVHSIEFGFKAPATLHDGTVVRAINDGYLVHMFAAVGGGTKANAKKIMALLKAGKDSKAEKLSKGFAQLSGPVSTGGVSQRTLNAKPGYYVLACFMSTQDHREHTQLGMLRLVRIAK